MMEETTTIGDAVRRIKDAKRMAEDKILAALRELEGETGMQFDHIEITQERGLVRQRSTVQSVRVRLVVP